MLTSLSANFKERKLTYRAWLPFDYSSTRLFFLIYIHQFISLVTAGLLNIACDTLICGLLVHVCCQLEILTYRLKKIIFYSDILRDCIVQHYHIFRLVLIILQIFWCVCVCFILLYISLKKLSYNTRCYTYYYRKLYMLISLIYQYPIYLIKISFYKDKIVKF